MAETSWSNAVPSHPIESAGLDEGAWNALMDALPDAIVLVDRQWRLTYANAEAMRISRLTAADLSSKSHWELYPETVGSPIESVYRRVMATRVAEKIEYLYEPFGVWFDIHAMPVGESVTSAGPESGGIALYYRDITARKNADRDHETTRRLLQQVLDATSDAVVSLDRNWNYTFLNRQAELLLQRGDLLGKNLWREFPSTEADGPLRRTMEERIACELEVFNPAPLDRWLRIQTRPSPEGIVVFFRDVTEERAARQALLVQQDTLDFVQEAARIATWVVDLATEEIRFTGGSYPVYARPLTEIRTLNDIRRLVPTEDLAQVLASGRVAVESSGVTSYDYRVVAPDGSIIWLERRCVRVCDEQGVPTHLRGMTTDISARKHDEQRLAAGEIRYRLLIEELGQKQQETERHRAELEALYENAPIGLALFDPVEFRWLRLNETQAEITGMKKEELLHTRLFDLVKIPGVQQLFERVAAGTPVLDQFVEGELPTRPGEHRYWTVNYHPVFANDGTVQAITAASLEITHQRKSELALIQSEKLAAVGRLASSISHEINNPLEAITNLLYLVATDPELPEAIKVYVLMAQSELARVSQIATQTLRFHRQAMNPTKVTAADLVRAVLDLYQGRLTNSAIKVETRYASRTPILCFENDIRQVLNNLIANAIDAMRTGGRLLVRAHDATAWTKTTPRPGVRITIADTGHGMSPAVQSRVFEPFYTTKDLNGTGLGLWISAGIVQHHQGRLALRSSENQKHHGTIFTLFLPLVEDPA